MEQPKPIHLETPSNNRVPVPRYNPYTQIHVSPTDERGDYRIPELYAIALEKRRAGQEIQAQTGFRFSDTGGLGLEWAIANTDTAVGRMFQVHGIEKGDPIAELDKIHEDGIDPQRTLYSMPFIQAGKTIGAFGADIPKTGGGIYLISGYRQRLTDQENGGVRFIGVGEEYMQVVDLLQQLWKEKDVRVVPWHDLPRVLTEAANTATGAAEPSEVLTEENQPYYPVRKTIGPLGKVSSTPDEPSEVIEVSSVENIW